jgi:VWFA-related protein
MCQRTTVCLICCLGSLSAQDDSSRSQTPFRVQTDVVQVPVSVKDSSGRNIDGLVAHDFTVLEDGFPLEVALDAFGRGSAPISLVIAIQTSGLSTPTLQKLSRIGGMIQPLVIGLRGEAAVLTFDGEIAWRQDFTSDDIRIRQAVNNLKPGTAVKEARMLDAIAAVADRMKERKGRRVLLLISESRDRGSETTFQQALESVMREGIEVFGAHYSAYATTWAANSKYLPDSSSPPITANDPSPRPDSAPAGLDLLAIFAELPRLGQINMVQALTEATGGSDYPFVKERGVEAAIEKLGVEVHSQYILSFPRQQNATGLHQIDVSVPNRRDFLIRWRRGYSVNQISDTH